MALEVLRATHRGRRLDRALEEEARGLPRELHPWVREATYGVTRDRGRLDFELEEAVSGGLSRLHPDVLQVLRLGLYQVRSMGGVPDYAALSQTVELCRAAGHPRAAGLVNAVLRRAARRSREDVEAAFPELEKDPPGHLTTAGSHPAWLVSRWLSRWTPREVAGLVAFNNRIPPVYVRGPEGWSAARVQEALAGAGAPVARRVDETGSVALARPDQIQAALSAGPFWVQDPGASLVTRYVAPPETGLVADLCAAPGGKALALAGPGRRVVAADPSLPRLARVVESAHRLGLPIHPVVARAEAPPLSAAELVLLDVPCSGTGTLGRHPDARWRLTAEDLGTLVGLQREILAGAARAVVPGGLLVYSTCTLEPEENREQVRRFLEGNPEFSLEPPAPGTVPGLEGYLDGEGYLEVLPQVHGFDGAFAARLRRRS